MYLVAIAWMYVVMMMAVVEALSPQGTVLGAFVTFALYGLLPVGIVVYVMGTPARMRARRAAQAPTATADAETGSAAGTVQTTPATHSPSSPQPDAGGHAAGGAVSAERKES